VIDFLGMMGDEISWIPGVGDRYAEILKEYGSMENLGKYRQLKGDERKHRSQQRKRYPI
jgi:5'-3' exonuclease